MGPEMKTMHEAFEQAEAVDPWPDLTPFGDIDLPTLDLAHLPGFAGEFSIALSANTEVPPELAATAVLAVASSACARRFRVQVTSDYFEYSNLWLQCALAPGNRKSAVMTAAINPLVDYELDQYREMREDILRAESENATAVAKAKELRSKAAKAKDEDKSADLARQAADVEANLPKIPRPPRLWTSDATPERLGTLLAENGERMAWLSSEGGIFDTLGGRYSSGIPNLDLVLKSHSGDADRLDRSGRPSIFLAEPLLTIGLSSQPEILKGLAAKPNFRGRGLIGRLIFFLPHSPLGYRTLQGPAIPESTKAKYAAGIGAMLNWPQATNGNGEPVLHVVRLSPEALRDWKEFALLIEKTMQPDGICEDATDWAGKAPGAAIRVAAVLHGITLAFGSPWEKEISEATMNAALEIMAVATKHSLAAIGLMEADEGFGNAKRLLRWIGKKRRASFTAKEAFDGLRGTFKKMDKMEQALAVLKGRGYVLLLDSENVKAPGRPSSPVFLVRPSIVAAWS